MSLLNLNNTPVPDFLNITTNIQVVKRKKDICEFWLFFISGCLMNIICISGLITNVLAIIVWSGEKLKTVTTIVVISLEIVDCIYLLQWMVALSIRDFLKEANYDLFVPFTKVAYGFASYGLGFWTAFSISSAWHIVFLTTERYVAICHPTLSKKLTIRNATIFCVLITILSNIYTIPRYFEYELFQLPDSTYLLREKKLGKSHSYGIIYRFVLNNITNNYAPILIILVLSILTVKTIRQKTSDNKSALSSSVKQITSSIMAVNVVLLISYSCESVRAILAHSNIIRVLTCGDPWWYFSLITFTLKTVNSSINFYLFAVFNTKFRKRLKKIFRNNKIDSQNDQKSFSQSYQ